MLHTALVDALSTPDRRGVDGPLTRGIADGLLCGAPTTLTRLANAMAATPEEAHRRLASGRRRSTTRGAAPSGTC